MSPTVSRPHIILNPYTQVGRMTLGLLYQHMLSMSSDQNRELQMFVLDIEFKDESPRQVARILLDKVLEIKFKEQFCCENRNIQTLA